ncbi:hypothetical protein AWV80_23430 [Cupriavidus sp. UYMU48A]|nr:hypothetical protein AWV80_23430 [Cupriavidus sp. UYMU48A]
MFDEILTWDAQASAVQSGPHLFAGLPQWIQDRTGNIITTLLLPSMTAEERTAERCTRLLEVVKQNGGWSGLAALTHFFKCHDGLASKLSRLIVKGLIAPNHQGVQSAALAVVAWAERHKDGAEEVPHDIYSRLLSAIELAPEHGLNSLLECARKLLAIGRVPAEFPGRLMDALSDLLSRTNYMEIDTASIRAVSISLVRAQCVKLAVALMPLVEDDGTLERWLDEAKADALPEVRFAAQD